MKVENGPLKPKRPRPKRLQWKKKTRPKRPQLTSKTAHYVTLYKYRINDVITSDKILSYSDRLQKFGLTTLETRRLRGDLIDVFKMFKGFDNITLNDFFKLSSTTLRGHTLKIYKPQLHVDVGKFFFKLGL